MLVMGPCLVVRPELLVPLEGTQSLHEKAPVAGQVTHRVTACATSVLMEVGK